jgi:predicted nucleic acid-binding protein
MVREAPAAGVGDAPDDAGRLRPCLREQGGHRRRCRARRGHPLLLEITALDRHEFWHEFWVDDVEGVVGPDLDAGLVVGHRQVTDVHLLALAVARGGRLATLDRGLRSLAPPGVVAFVLAS